MTKGIVCRKCLAPGRRTNWLPSLGMDPQLRQYKCDNCGLTWFVRTGRKQRVKKRAVTN